MTTAAPRPVVTRPYPVQRAPRGGKFWQHLHTTDPKVLGVMYIATSFARFMIGGHSAAGRPSMTEPGSHLQITDDMPFTDRTFK